MGVQVLLALILCSIQFVSCQYSLVLPTAISLVELNCGENEIIYVKDVLQLRRWTYDNNENCSWTFITQPDNQLDLKIEVMSVEMHESGSSCFDYYEVLPSGGKKICHPTTETRTGNLTLKFVSDVSKFSAGFFATITSSCSILGAIDPWIVYTLPLDYKPRNLAREVIFKDESTNSRSRKEYLTLGKDVGKPFCPVLKPLSEIPFCLPRSPSECEWESREIKRNYSHHSNPTLSISNNVSIIRTISADLQLESICMTVEYVGPMTMLTLAAQNSGNVTELNISSIQLFEQKNEGGDEMFAVKKIFGVLPERLIRKPLRLLLSVLLPEGTTVHIRKIAGCILDRNVLYYPSPMDKGYELAAISKNPPIEISHDSNCENGGFKKGNRCVCPVGFSGEKCEIGCGPNKFGPSCEGVCSLYTRKCFGKIFCKNDFGCDCATGYLGSECATECGPGFYGAGCRQVCGKCKNAEPCDIFTGECTHGCSTGYIPPQCRQVFAHVSSLKVDKVAFKTAVLTAKLPPSFTVTREGVNYLFYNTQYREVESDEWKDIHLEEIEEEEEEYKVILPALIPGRHYEARVLLFTNSGLSYQGEQVPTVTFTTLCKGNPLKITVEDITSESAVISWEGTSNDEYRCQEEKYIVELSSLVKFAWKQTTIRNNSINLNGLAPQMWYVVRVKPHGETIFYYSSFITQPEVFGQVKELTLNNVTPRSISLEWKKVGHNGDKYITTYMCTMVMADKNFPCNDDSGTVETTENNVEVTGLSPFRQYKLQVRHLPGYRHSEITALTKSAVPEASPEVKSVIWSNSSIKVEWGPPKNCSLCNGRVRGYKYVLLDDDLKLVKEGKTKWNQKNEVKIENLTPSTNYKLKILMENNVGVNNSAAHIIEFETKASVPLKVTNLEVYKKTRNSVGLRWGKPKNSYGNLTAFMTSVNPSSRTKEIWETDPTPCSAWPEYFCMTISELIPETVYNFTVTAMNDRVSAPGHPSIISAETIESAPEIPVNLRVRNQSDSSMTLQWEPPRLFNGHLRSFLIKLEQTKSYISTECCTYYPKVDIEVKNEQSVYHTELMGLNSGSTFAVSVMAETVWLGPPARVTACTRPPVPPLSLSVEKENVTSLQWILKGNLTSKPEESNVHLSEIILVKALRVNWLTKTGIEDLDLREVLIKDIGQSFYYIGQPVQGSIIKLQNGAFEGVRKIEYDWGKPRDVPWEGNINYTLIIASIYKYCNLHSISTSEPSQPFIVSSVEIPT